MLRFDANLRMLFTEMPLLERFSAAALAGFRGVEVPSPYEIAAPELSAILRDNELTLVEILAPVDFTAGSPGIAAHPHRIEECRKSIEQAIEYSSRVGRPMVHVVAGVLDKDADRRAAMETYKGNIGFAADLAAKEGIEIIVEPVSRARLPNYLYSTLQEAAQIIDELGRRNVKLCVDTYHVQMEEGGLTTKMREYHRYLGHVQIGDTPGRNEPGSGELDFDDIFRTLETLGWDRWVGCEYVPSGTTLDSLGWHAPFRARPVTTTDSPPLAP